MYYIFEYFDDFMTKICGNLKKEREREEEDEEEGGEGQFCHCFYISTLLRDKMCILQI